MLTTVFNYTLSSTWWTVKTTYNSIYYLLYGDVEKQERERQARLLDNIKSTEDEQSQTLNHVEDTQQQITNQLHSLQTNESEMKNEIKHLRNDIKQLTTILKIKNEN